MVRTVHNLDTGRRDQATSGCAGAAEDFGMGYQYAVILDNADVTLE